MISIVGGGDDRLVVVDEESDEVVGQPADEDEDDADERNSGRVHLLLVPVHELKAVTSLVLLFGRFSLHLNLIG